MSSNVLRKSFENLLRNWMTTIPTILVMAIILTMFHGLLVVKDGAQNTLQAIQQKFSVTVYLRDDADSFETANLITELEQRPDVIKPVIFTSKEEAWKTMNDAFSLDDELLNKYKFSLPASITITPKRLEDAKRIESFLHAAAGNLIAEPTESKNKQKNISDQMIEFIQNVRNATIRNLLFFTLIFIIGGALMLGSAIHLAIASRHLEIKIMKLVGASYATITIPFVIEGIMLGVLSFVLHLILSAALPFGENLMARSNTLLLEFMTLIILSAAVSYLTTLLHIRKKIL